jgi:hypothetical protein
MKDDNFLTVRLKKNQKNKTCIIQSHSHCRPFLKWGGMIMYLRFNYTTRSMDVWSVPEHYAPISNHNVALKQMISKHNIGSLNY